MGTALLGGVGTARRDGAPTGRALSWAAASPDKRRSVAGGRLPAVAVER
ncbi:hypothetical protein SLT36_20760 [Aminobacter sp. BA135]